MTTALSRNSSAYKNMSCYGITASALIVVSFWEHRWALKVTKPSNMPRDTFKRHVEHFLEVEFEASEFKWSGAKQNPQHSAFCAFKSFAL